LTVAQTQVDEDVVAAAVGNDQVEDAVAVEVGQRDLVGRQHAVLAALLPARAGPGILDRDPVEGLVGEDELRPPVAVDVGHGEGRVAVEPLVGSEGAVAVAQ
jgi:hypothetical protein